MAGIGIWQLLIVLALVAMLFGTRKLRGSGEDLGAAIRSFKSALNRNDDEPPFLASSTTASKRKNA